LGDVLELGEVGKLLLEDSLHALGNADGVRGHEVVPELNRLRVGVVIEQHHALAVLHFHLKYLYVSIYLNIKINNIMYIIEN
jgi:hypothetical protein